MKNCSLSVGVVVLTLQGARHLLHCLPPLIASPLRPRILVVDSSSDDNTVEIAEQLGASVLVIPRAIFNHGSTREMARHYLGTDIAVMVTQDAYAIDSEALGLLVAPLLAGQAAVSYGRQLPRLDAGVYESFHRHFNYPATSHHRSLADVGRYGKYTFFCSNSFAAYRNSALDSVGGFPAVLFGEDTVAVAALLRQGHSIAYVAEAGVYHSHNYTLQQELKRHFDIGYSRREHSDLLATPDGDEVRGKAYAGALLRHLWRTKPTRLPYGLILLAAKWFGYQAGRHGHHLPHWLQCQLSTHKSYFHAKRCCK